MSSDGWGTSWAKQTEPAVEALAINSAVEYQKQPMTPWEQTKADIGRAPLDIIPRIYNKVPTHDPYTNPNAELYYSCNCGAILDPGTKRFAELNGHASNAGWKIRFTDTGYVPYCVECGKGVE